MCVTWLVHVCDMTRSCVWHDSFMCVTWLIHVCNMTHSCVWHDSFMCVTWLVHVCDMTRSCVWHDSFMCVTWLFRVCELTQRLILVYAMTNSCVWHNSSVSVRGLIQVCERDMTYATDDLVLQPPHNSFMCFDVTRGAHKHESICIIIISRQSTWMSYVTHVCVRSFMCFDVNNYSLDMTRSSLSFVYNDLFMCMTWLIRVCAMTPSNYHMTHSCVWRDPCSDMTYSCDENHVCVHHESCSRHYGTPTTP